jgi:hypothetical protein
MTEMSVDTSWPTEAFVEGRRRGRLFATEGGRSGVVFAADRASREFAMLAFMRRCPRLFCRPTDLGRTRIFRFSLAHGIRYNHRVAGPAKGPIPLECLPGKFPPHSPRSLGLNFGIAIDKRGAKEILLREHLSDVPYRG